MTRPVDGDGCDLCSTSAVLPTLKGTVDGYVEKHRCRAKGHAIHLFSVSQLPCFSVPTPLPAASNASIVICVRRNKPVQLSCSLGWCRTCLW
jgi:hypothetical protein